MDDTSAGSLRGSATQNSAGTDAGVRVDEGVYACPNVVMTDASINIVPFGPAATLPHTATAKATVTAPGAGTGHAGTPGPRTPHQILDAPSPPPRSNRRSSGGPSPPSPPPPPERPSLLAEEPVSPPAMPTATVTLQGSVTAPPIPTPPRPPRNVSYIEANGVPGEGSPPVPQRSGGGAGDARPASPPPPPLRRRQPTMEAQGGGGSGGGGGGGFVDGGDFGGGFVEDVGESKFKRAASVYNGFADGGGEGEGEGEGEGGLEPPPPPPPPRRATAEHAASAGGGAGDIEAPSSPPPFAVMLRVPGAGREGSAPWATDSETGWSTDGAQGGDERSDAYDPNAPVSF